MPNAIDKTALFKIGYGLYVVTSNDGVRDNGLIVNTVMQLTESPMRISVTINKSNYSHDVIKASGKMNVNCLAESAPFKVFEHFGFKSGRDYDKFQDCKPNRSENGLIYLPHYINAYFSLEVESYTDLGTHGMFICSVTEAVTVSGEESMTYSYYHKNVKPKPEKKEAKSGKRRFVCTVCGFTVEAEELPEDYECPLCKHGRDAFIEEE